jgi:hypothetical protein
MATEAEKPDLCAFRKGAVRPPLNYADLRRLVVALFEELETDGWFQESLGLDCVDNHPDIGARVVLDLGYPFWPFSATMPEQEEDWLFTAIEYSHEHVAEPGERSWHGWDMCGWHVSKSDRLSGQAKFRTKINDLLARYEPRYTLADDGFIYERPPDGLQDLLSPESSGDEKLDSRVTSALRAFRRYGATDDDKRHAIRDLAAIFERLRATSGTGLPPKDEGELFTIANQFGIRHFNPKQKTEYDAEPWLDWIFYAFLNSYRLVTRLPTRPVDGRR